MFRHLSCSHDEAIVAKGGCVIPTLVRITFPIPTVFFSIVLVMIHAQHMIQTHGAITFINNFVRNTLVSGEICVIAHHKRNKGIYMYVYTIQAATTSFGDRRAVEKSGRKTIIYIIRRRHADETSGLINYNMHRLNH